MFSKRFYDRPCNHCYFNTSHGVGIYTYKNSNEYTTGSDVYLIAYNIL